MSLDSSIFLFLALPLILIIYYGLGVLTKNIKVQNTILLILNLLLYAFGEPLFVLLLLGVMAVNFGLALIIHKCGDQNPILAKALMICAVAVDLGLLVFFKYFTFLSDIFNSLLGLPAPEADQVLKIAQPLGISFFTFQAVSYVVDAYKGVITPTKNFIKFGAYFSLFAQITAGPIVRFKDVEAQLDNREYSLDGFAGGLKRFLIGLGQKIMLANYFGKIANEIFDLSAVTLGGDVAWIGIIFYTLQIYFDFAGYSSMAIGIARMLGLTLKENFDHPYEADSITTFWRRWHISLSGWFRDYVYFPMGGSRRGKARMYLGVFTVFALSGIWHGANLTFLVWGVYHGIFNMIEKIPAVKGVIAKTPKPLRHVYVMLVVTVGWVFFRASDITQAFDYLGAMLFLHGVGTGMPAVSIGLIIIALLGAIGATSIFTKIKNRIEATGNKSLIITASVVSWVFLLAIFAICVPIILAGGAMPFIYAQF